MTTTDNAIVLQTGGDYLVPAASLEQVLATYQWKKEFIERVLREGVDFGTTPGTGEKPSLKKPGAEKMASFFGLAPVFEDVECVEDWTGADHNSEPFFYYRQKCKLYRADRLIATADGSCNSWEKKYRYRQADRVCPNCGKPAVFKSKPRPTDPPNKPQGYYCWNKKGGCGATFAPNDPSITEQEVGQVKNPDVSEQVNTILKMAQKRALVAAVLIATNASDYFTQDLDDFVTGEIIDATATTSRGQASVNPDPIDDNAWAKWQALCARADAVNVQHASPVRENTAKSDLRLAYTELQQFVKQAEAQEAAVDPTYGSAMPDPRTGDGEN